jgi:hypothetical protein
MMSAWRFDDVTTDKPVVDWRAGEKVPKTRPTPALDALITLALDRLLPLPKKPAVETARDRFMKAQAAK